MPPKIKITKDMIIEAAFLLAREDGVESLNVRSIAGRLNCSTQPVLYQFKTVDEIKEEVYKRADEFHTNYIMNFQGKYDNPLLELGMNYVNFAREETNLFRLLFQSNQFSRKGLYEIVTEKDTNPIISLFADKMNVSMEEAVEYFLSVFLTVHGYASMLANNSMKYDEELILRILQKYE